MSIGLKLGAICGYGVREQTGSDAMNIERIINMVIHQITRRLVNGGINAGINAVSGKGQKAAHDGQGRQQPAPGQNGAKQAKQAMRVMRKMNKF